MQAYHRRRGALSSAIEAGIVGRTDETATAMFTDMGILHATVSALKRAPFPAGTLHTFAVKSNPVGRVLELLRDAGLGAEVASLGELRQALAAGFSPDRVVFDSPIKTLSELRFALQAGVRLNLDNLEEVQRVNDLITQEPYLITGTTASGSNRRLIGLRINPQVGEGRIAALSTAGRVSKFGIPLLECRGQLLAAIAAHPWINGLHLHVGSQGVPLELTVEGIARVVELAEEVEVAFAAARVSAGTNVESSGKDSGVGGGGRRILTLDIGGGLPVDYSSDDLDWLLGSAAETPPQPPCPRPQHDPDVPHPCHVTSSIFERYAVLLRQRVPALFTRSSEDSRTAVAAADALPEASMNRTATAVASPLFPVVAAAVPALQLMTEFGRCMVAKAVFAAGRVEYSKLCGGRRVVVSGLGGDLLLRAVYLPNTWPVRVELYDTAGRPKLPLPPLTPPLAVPQESRSEGLIITVANADSVAVEAVSAAETLDSTNHDEGGLAPTDVVGPLCFQGDRLAEAVMLPPASSGDWVVVPDVGAYCLSMYSRYNSRCSPPVWGFRRRRSAAVVAAMVAVNESHMEYWDGEMPLPAGWAVTVGDKGDVGGGGGAGVVQCGEYEFVLLRRGETVEEVMAFWNLL